MLSEHPGYIKHTRVTHLGMSVCTNPDFLQAACVNLNWIEYKNYKKTLLIIIFTSRYSVGVSVTVLACIGVVVRGVVLSLSCSLSLNIYIYIYCINRSCSPHITVTVSPIFWSTHIWVTDVSSSTGCQSFPLDNDPKTLERWWRCYACLFIETQLNIFIF